MKRKAAGVSRQFLVTVFGCKDFDKIGRRDLRTGKRIALHHIGAASPGQIDLPALLHAFVR